MLKKPSSYAEGVLILFIFVLAIVYVATAFVVWDIKFHNKPFGPVVFRSLCLLSGLLAFLLAPEKKNKGKVKED